MQGASKRLFKGIVLTQNEEVTSDGGYFLHINVENKSVYTVVLSFDFTDSKKIRFLNDGVEETRNSVFEEEVEPSEDVREVVTISATNNWVISYNLDYTLTFPDKNSIKSKINAEEQKIDKRIKEYRKLEMAFWDADFQELMVEVSQRGLQFIDMEFLPLPVA